uniref:Galectin n=1 Tax=Monopterus albus TaxID=43700 RepID=A0A3Q3KA42_MONAL
MLKSLLVSNGHVCNCKLVSSTLSRISVLVPDTSVSSSSSPPPSQHSDALSGSCPSAGSAPQANSLWSSLPTSGSGFPAWPGQSTQSAPCWPRTQTAPVSPAPVPRWPGTQYQPPHLSLPKQVPVPAPPAPAPATSDHPNVPGWPTHPPRLALPHRTVMVAWAESIYHASTLGSTHIRTSSNVPYNLNLPCGVYDKMMMTILAHVQPNAKMFTVNFLRGNDVAFHINPRFNEGGKQVVVCNHKVGERWGSEERDLKGPFPFALGIPFKMKILCTHEAFKVAVNNIPLFEFKHRVRGLNQVGRINILHDIILTYVDVETLP